MTESLERHETRLPAAAVRLIEDTCTALKATFKGYGHRPSADQWMALGAIVETLAAMAAGTCEPKTYLSALDPGVGKSQAVIHFVKALLTSPEYGDTGVLICLQRKEQIADFVQEAKLNEADFAVYTADEPEGRKRFNIMGLGKENAGKARVLLTTHAMIERRCSLSRVTTFSQVSEFQYKTLPRPVRVWDEALLPGTPLTVERQHIGIVYGHLGIAGHRALATDLENLQAKLRTVSAGDTYYIEDLGEKHGVDITTASWAMRGNVHGERVTEHLWHLFGRVVTVRADGGYEESEDGSYKRSNTALDYEDLLPADLWPILVLDASGRVRTLYDYWKTRRGGLELLPEGAKDYTGHTVHIWKNAGGKTAWTNHAKSKALIDGIINTIASKPDQEWLVIVHRKESVKGFDITKAITKRLPPEVADKVSFTTWGKHDATNEFAHIPNVILAGTLFFPQSLYEAKGRAASALPSAAGKFAQTDLDAVKLGEYRNVILQALCRGSVRRCEDYKCPSGTNTYIIAANSTGIPATIKDILPGCKVSPWRPQGQPVLKGKMAEALRVIVEHPEDEIAVVDVIDAIGWGTDKNGKKNFNRRVKSNPDFQAALSEAGFEVVGNGRPGRGNRALFAKIKPMFTAVA